MEMEMRMEMEMEMRMEMEMDGHNRDGWMVICTECVMRRQART